MPSSAVALAIYLTRPKQVTDEMFIAAAHATAEQVSPEEHEQGMLYPSQSHIFATEVATATKVAQFIFDEGLATVQKPKDLKTWCSSRSTSPNIPRANMASIEDTQISDGHYELGQLLDNGKFRVESDSMGQVIPADHSWSSRLSVC